MKRLLIIIVILLNCYIVLNSRLAFAQSKILINEFLIDPQPQQVEILNTGMETTDISGWIIDDSGGATFYTIPQSSMLYPNSCLVFSGDFNLNKTSADTVKLINNTELIDSFSYKSSSGSGISYFRLPDGENNWTTGSANLGFYNSSREQACLFPTITPTEIPSPTITPTIGSDDATISYENIYISEAMVNPETGNNEWVEIYNDNNFSVTLVDWFIDDLENAGSTPKIFSLEIPGKDYRVFNLSSSVFNNDGDSIRLLDFNKSLKDSFEYGSSTQEKSWGRTDLNNDNFCLQEPSYELSNNSCLNPTITPHQTPIPSTIKTSTPTKTIIISSKPIAKSTNYNTLMHQNIISQSENTSQGSILGISTHNTKNNFSLIRLLSFISFSYSLLTIMAVLFKMKFIYGKGEKFSPPFIYSNGKQ